MIDAMAGICSTSSGTTALELTLRDALDDLRTAMHAYRVLTVDGQRVELRLSRLAETVVEELRVAGRAP